MLHIEAGHSNYCRIILKLFGYDIFCNTLQHKKSIVNLVASEVLSLNRPGFLQIGMAKKGRPPLPCCHFSLNDAIN